MLPYSISSHYFVHSFIQQTLIGCQLCATVLEAQGVAVNKTGLVKLTFSLGETDSNHVGK